MSIQHHRRIYMNARIKLKVLVSIIYLLGAVAYGQELSNETAWEIKYGRTENLKHLTAPDRINECVGVADSKKYGYLAISIKLKSMKSLRFFVENGADIERVCADKTPLMYAAKYGQLGMVQYLVQLGANVGATYNRQNALGFARQFRHRNIIKYLKEQEKKLKAKPDTGIQ